MGTAIMVLLSRCMDSRYTYQHHDLAHMPEDHAILDESPSKIIHDRATLSGKTCVDIVHNWAVA